jgi:predicted nucleic acid-binding protein
LGIFGELHIPETVWSEATLHGAALDRLTRTAIDLRRSQVSAAGLAEHTAAHDLDHLHAGERECLFLCHEQGIELLLTDDLAVRAAAKGLAIQPVGSLGVVVRAHHQARLSGAAAERILLRLHEETSLFVTRAIIELAMRQLEDDSPPAA